jgi:hypothetical protein
METSVENLVAEAREMALELRLKDKLIVALQARLAAGDAERAVLLAEVDELTAELRAVGP